MGKKQDLMNQFYDVNNFVTVDVTMSPEKWESLKSAMPNGGQRFHYVGPPPRYEWYTADSVTISGTIWPKKPVTVTNVGIKKKSFMGSFSITKPSLRLDFGKNSNPTDEIEDTIGTRYMVLNNSIQDDSYLRQPIGYQFFKLAGVPAFRCNLGQVIVNKTLFGVYVNLESFEKRFVQFNFDDNDKGNGYEIEAGDDLKTVIIETPGYMSFEGFSKYDDKADILLAAQTIETEGISGQQKVVDMGKFKIFYLMESVLKHWDGYTQNTNNSYMYNDKIAELKPTLDDVYIELVPSGIDQILQPNRNALFGTRGLLAANAFSDSQTRSSMTDILAAMTETNGILTKSFIDSTVMSLIEVLTGLLTQNNYMTSTLTNSIASFVAEVQSLPQNASILLELLQLPSKGQPEN